MLNSFRVFLWDFDGVILNSMSVRDKGFTEVLKSYPENEVKDLLNYHRQNGGLSRYVKFRYFFEKIRNENVGEEKINEMAKDFSSIMLASLIDKNLIIEDALNFIKKNHAKFPMHIVSGSDGNELLKICEVLDIAKYFKSIHGSPAAKDVLIKNILFKYNYPQNAVALIGDSKNDFDAAMETGISFFGYNNAALKTLNSNYIFSFGEAEV